MSGERLLRRENIHREGTHTLCMIADLFLAQYGDPFLQIKPLYQIRLPPVEEDGAGVRVAPGPQPVHRLDQPPFADKPDPFPGDCVEFQEIVRPFPPAVDVAARRLRQKAACRKLIKEVSLLRRDLF